MWISKAFFQLVLDDNRKQTAAIGELKQELARITAVAAERTSQKTKDDLHLAWFTHRVNALEKEKVLLLQRITGVAFPVPEIVPTRPGTISDTYAQMPSFEDVGDSEAARLGAAHDEEGYLQFQDDMKASHA